MEHNNGRADNANGQGVTDAPKGSNERGVAYAALPAYDGGDRNHVIRVGCMANAEDDSDGDEADQAEHGKVQYKSGEEGVKVIRPASVSIGETPRRADRRIDSGADAK